MSAEIPSNLPAEAIRKLLLAFADDELMLGHRDSEWTGHAPILEEDIAFSNIAQDELGHSLVWYTLLEQLTGRSPDSMAFERTWNEFTCCHFVAYPRGDFAYTVVRQYLHDAAEQVRLSSLGQSSYSELKDVAAKLLPEESYHLMHSQGLVERLGDATEESHSRMQAAVDAAFPQALGLFENLDGEENLVSANVFPGNEHLRTKWLEKVVPVLDAASLQAPVEAKNGRIEISCEPDYGGRHRSHTAHLKELVQDLQKVYRMAPSAKW
ncbi:MAG: phenylacetate-CoA oxygenase subunit PaaC [Ignavibacteria bacterium]|nr:phenylacetate-CoA oxygenase subunit PaaC [Ignavibacteria bacterium]